MSVLLSEPPPFFYTVKVLPFVSACSSCYLSQLVCQRKTVGFVYVFDILRRWLFANIITTFIILGWFGMINGTTWC